MKLIHMSDIHLTAPGKTIGGRDPRLNFERALTGATATTMNGSRHGSTSFPFR